MVAGWDRMTPQERRRYTGLFVDWMQREIPGCRVAFKDDPPETIVWWHRVSHFFARLVSPDYDKRFTTVIYPVIYLPVGTRESWSAQPERFYGTLRHEFVHLKDFQRFGVWMGASYLALLPAFWTMRAFWELRGYAQNMIFLRESAGSVPDEQIDRLVEIFGGRDYIFMMSPRSRARRALEALRARVLSGELSGPYPYGPLDHAPPEVEDAAH